MVKFIKKYKVFLSTIFSGIAGVIITIGYQHFFAINQSLVFIYNGEEVLVTESEYIELFEENADLNGKLNKLQLDYNELEISKNVIQTQYNDVINQNNDLNDKIDKLIEANSKFEKIDIDSNKQYNSVNLFSLKPFDQSFWGIGITLAVDISDGDNKYIKDAWGNSYRNSYTCMFDYMDEYGWAYWVLDKPYKKLEGELVANQLTKSGAKIWLEFFDQDNNLIGITDYVTAKEVDHSYPIPIEINLEGATELKIRFRSDSRSTYGLMPKMVLVP